MFLNSGIYLTKVLTPAVPIIFPNSGICAKPTWLNTLA
jgi:hypothetical protein